MCDDQERSVFVPFLLIDRTNVFQDVFSPIVVYKNLLSHGWLAASLFCMLDLFLDCGCTTLYDIRD
jgi:hypothetical protein